MVKPQSIPGLAGHAPVSVPHSDVARYAVMVQRRQDHLTDEVIPLGLKADGPPAPVEGHCDSVVVVVRAGLGAILEHRLGLLDAEYQ
ncbi:hypothetical protein THAOC_03969, partial [Thalassiosira oceanica]